MSEQRFTALEEKIAYQEDTIKVLNDVVYRQQVRIDRVEALCRQLLDRVQASDEPGVAGLDSERPPHY